MHKRLFRYLETIMVVMIWAASPPLIKILLENLTPFEITGIRYFEASSAQSDRPGLALPRYYGRHKFCSRRYLDLQRIGID